MSAEWLEESGSERVRRKGEERKMSGGAHGSTAVERCVWGRDAQGAECCRPRVVAYPPGGLQACTDAVGLGSNDILFHGGKRALIGSRVGVRPFWQRWKEHRILLALIEVLYVPIRDGRNMGCGSRSCQSAFS